MRTFFLQEIHVPKYFLNVGLSKGLATEFAYAQKQNYSVRIFKDIIV